MVVNILQKLNLSKVNKSTFSVPGLDVADLDKLFNIEALDKIQLVTLYEKLVSLELLDLEKKIEEAVLENNEAAKQGYVDLYNTVLSLRFKDLVN